MASVDKQIQLAERIASELLQGLKNASRNSRQERDLIKASRGEWMKWLQIVGQSSLRYGVDYAQRIGNDITLRANIKTINGEIGNVVRRHERRLSAFSPEQQQEVLGYVAWYLRIAAG